MTVVTLIPGDGIGPEITDAVLEILEAAQVPIEFEEQQAGLTAFREVGDLIPAELLASIVKNRVALKGPLTTPVGEGFKSINVTLRQKFDLYQNVRPSRSVPGLDTPFKDVDLVLFRENTEGLYSGFEVYDARNGIADAIARSTEKGLERIIRAAFTYAEKMGRKKVTVVHKANIIKQSGAMLLRAAERISTEFPTIEKEDRIIDNMAMQMVMYPSRYDVIVTTNLFGDILSDLAAGLVGGLGLVPGANIGDGYAIFEAVHGSAPDIAGKNIANPSALLQSAIMMLHHLDMVEHANRIEKALHKTLAEKEKTTGDLGGKASTSEFAQHVIANMA